MSADATPDASRWRVVGPFRSQDRRAVWRVVRALQPASEFVDIHSEAMTEQTAQRLADEMNAAAAADRP